MATTLVQDGHRITVTLGADATSGDVITIGDIYGIALVDGLSGETIECATSGVWEVPAAAAQTFTQGEEIGFTAGEATAAGTGGGNAWASATTPTTIAVLINGVPGAGG